MSPFNGHPEGFSTASLRLLDEGLHRMLLDAQIAAEAKEKTIGLRRRRGRTAGGSHDGKASD